MKTKRFFAQALTLLILLLTATFSGNTVLSDLAIAESKLQGQIYFYGEQHGVDKLIDKEFELWFDYYHNENMRHLFMEKPYYSAKLLNLWMQTDNDEILDVVYYGSYGSFAYNPSIKEFYKRIKLECPETIFHGTDVGHHSSMSGIHAGEWFLEYLETNGMEGSDQYLLTQEAIEQGRFYYSRNDYVYREQMLVKNFIREFDSLNGENIMGIYGSAHTGLDAMIGSVPTMANQLKKRYGNAVHEEDLVVLLVRANRVESIVVNGKEYEASYFGQQNMPGFSDFAYRKFWRLENAYEDFKNNPLRFHEDSKGNQTRNSVLPYSNYPMLIEIGQVFVIDYAKTDGSFERKYFRSDGYIWNGLPSTEEFVVN